MSRRLASIAALACFVSAQALGWFAGPGNASEPTAFDPDGYMRLLRVERLWNGGGWFDGTSPDSNFPHGETLHWTRPLDLLIAAGASPAAPALGPRRAIFAAGALASPLLGLFALLLLCWATRPWLRGRGVLILALLFSLLPGLRTVFLAGRPDHHALIHLAFVAQLAVLARALSRQARERDFLFAGAAAALGIWANVESLLGVAFVLVALGMAWLIEGALWAKRIARFLVATAALLLVAVALEHPPGSWLAAEYDRVSAVQLALFACLAAAWAAVARVSGRAGSSPRGRMGLSVAALVVALAPMALLFPRFFAGPFSDTDPALMPVWLDLIVEFRPLFGDPRQAAAGVMAFAPIVFVIPWVLTKLRREDNPQRGLQSVLLLGLAVFLPLAVWQVRWEPYAELFLALLLAPLLDELLGWRPVLDGVGPVRLGAVVAPLALLVPMLLATRVLSAADANRAGEEAPITAAAGCDWAGLAPALRELPQDPSRPTLFAPLFAGPELLYRVGRPVVGTPYHRNRQGILDTLAFFGTADLEAARRLADERRAGFVLQCRDSPELRNLLAQAPRDCLAASLLTGKAPAWLEPVELPAGLDEQFLLFRVAPAR